VVAEVDERIAGFAAEVGTQGPVAVAGGRTQWDVGGRPHPGTRVVSAPVGIVDHRPAEMTVRVLAGTTAAALDERLAPAGQMVPLDIGGSATVGGVLSVGRSGIRRLRWGPVRDYVLETRYVGADGQLVRAGAPVVKNVSGFDLVRLLVGSLGTLGCLAEVVLRTVPRPAASEWWCGPGDQADAALDRLYRPAAVLWNGERTWVLLEGHPEDLVAEVDRLGGDWERSLPPSVPDAGRTSLDPAELPSIGGRLPAGSFLAQMGVGVLHLDVAAVGLVTPRRPDAAAEAIGRRIKEGFDPAGRLNPGRRP